MWFARRWAPATLALAIAVMLVVYGVAIIKTSGQYWLAGMAVFVAALGTWSAIWLYVRCRVRILSKGVH